MVLKIETSERCSLTLEDANVLFCDPPVSSAATLIPYNEIDGILMAPDGTLSFQARGQVFKIQTRTEDPEHQQVIAALVNFVSKTS